MQELQVRIVSVGSALGILGTSMCCAVSESLAGCAKLSVRCQSYSVWL